jgi:hypothetical protein
MTATARVSRYYPRTAAGRALLDWYAPADNEHDPERERMGGAILAIEQEAATLDRDRLADLLHDAMLEWVEIFSERGPQYAEPSWADTKAAAIAAAYEGEGE